MVDESLPIYDRGTNNFSCCPNFNPVAWDNRTFIFRSKPFIKLESWRPISSAGGMQSILRKAQRTIRKSDAQTDSFVILTNNNPLMKNEHFFAVERFIPGQKNVSISGKFESKVFRGSNSETKNLTAQLTRYIMAGGQKVFQAYFYFVYCPGCANSNGDNFVVGFAQVA